MTADNSIETLDITGNIARVFPTRIFSLSEKQVDEALTMMQTDDSALSCWVRREARALYLYPYLTVEKQIFRAHRNLFHLMLLNPNFWRLLWYNPCLAQGTVRM